MKRVCAKCLIFIALFLTLDHCLYELLSKQHVKSALNPVLPIAGIKPEVVFLGTSRFKGGIDPRIFEKAYEVRAYNLGENGHGIGYARALQACLLAYHRPRMIVLEVMERFPIERQLPRLADLFYIEGARDALLALPWKHRAMYTVFKSLRFNQRWKKLFTESREVDPRHGYAPHYGTVAKAQSTRDKRRRMREIWAKEPVKPGKHYRAKDRISPEAEEWLLEQFILTAKDHGIDVVFVKMPRIQYVKTMSCVLYERMAKKHGIPFWDFSYKGNYFFELPDEYVWDTGNHLNHKGAEAFTKVLGQKLSMRLSGKS